MDTDFDNTGLEALLNLNGMRYWPGPYHWVKFEAYRIEPTRHIPHGIRYSLTLHDINSTRLIGFDNAHAIKYKNRHRRKYAGRIITWDHVHKLERVNPYDFDPPAQLLADFWKTVDEFIGR